MTVRSWIPAALAVADACAAPAVPGSGSRTRPPSASSTIGARLCVTGATYVHVARAPRSGAPRVIGIWRP